MNNIIKELEAIALSDKEVLDLLGHKANLILYPELHKYKNIDDVLGKYGACIILFESKPKYGHWTVLFKATTTLLEFFNPYGGLEQGYPDDGLEHIDLEFREKTNQLLPTLSLLMIDSPYELSYNEYKFQRLAKGINTCGRHCVVRLWCRDLTLNQYYEMLTREAHKYGIDYDAIVTVLTS